MADLGIPAGLARYMAVDLQGALRPGERRVRISSNMEVYWDQVLADDGRAAAPVRTTALLASEVELRWHGFPRRLRSDPEEYDFHDPAAAGPFARPAGLYTRYGDVLPLLEAADDRLAILGPGDAVMLSFDARRLPPLPDGWERTFFFFAHGYEKDMDDYTADPLTVEPLPFGAMPSYPYPDRAYPSRPDLLRYRLEYNTRRVDREAWTAPAGLRPEPSEREVDPPLRTDRAHARAGRRRRHPPPRPGPGVGRERGQLRPPAGDAGRSRRPAHLQHEVPGGRTIRALGSVDGEPARRPGPRPFVPPPQEAAAGVPEGLAVVLVELPAPRSPKPPTKRLSRHLARVLDDGLAEDQRRRTRT